MYRKALLLLIITLFISHTSLALADDKTAGDPCTPGVDRCVTDGYDCLIWDDPKNISNPPKYLCQENKFGKTFGKIKAPESIKKFGGNDTTGAGGISQFLSNLIGLLYSIAAVVLVFMLIWGAWDWLTSGGDKEQLQSAQKKIINAIIGIILFAVAFAVIQALGHFTGFTFFAGQIP